jgi:hypothetical protein
MHVARWRVFLGVVFALAVSGCTGPTGSNGIVHPEVPAKPAQTLAKENLQVLSREMKLFTVNAAQPERVLKSVALVGLPSGDQIIGMDYRIAKGLLYALSRQGWLFTLNPDTGVLSPVSKEPLKVALNGTAFGVDFNPVADRIRVVSDSGMNLRLHPDTGAIAAQDPTLNYTPGDPQGLNEPQLVAAAYTYNKKDEKLTTNYAIDRRLGTLVTQGSIEGAVPSVSPNTGLLRTVGSLQLGPLQDASFDIADVTGTALAAVRTMADASTRLVKINLLTGQAQVLGRLGDGSPVVGMAVEP